MNNSLPPNTNTAPTEPIQLGHYELLDCIGRGGMGLVYRARDTRLDRQVAIKCLRTELFEAHYVERFKREALLLAKLNHPNIVQIYDFIEAPDQLALVMELVEGQNLQLHLREHIVPFAQRMRWLTEIAQGLAVAHDAGIIHRDLKAENILINQRKVAKITDLGIAKSQHFNATLTDHVAGSYCSMSPEQAMGEAIDFKSDLFSFGILAYQLLCGAHPFGDTNNKLQLMQRIISHPPTAPGKHNPNLPAEINDLLGQLLSKDPAKRPDNTHWVAAQFEKLSHLQLTNDLVSDDTQAIIPNGSAANQSNVKSSGINSAVRTQDHPTFETRFIAVNTAPKKSRWLPIKNYLIENKISVSFGLFSVLILAAVVIWQLQPKPPKYVAVIPPKLTAEGIQESQQELIKEAVYDAIQQSVIQLDGYYLIPRDEVADVNGDNEAIRKATAANELITTEIKCSIDACRIEMARLASEKKDINSRLKTESSKTIDTLTENYSLIASVTEKNVFSMYSTKNFNLFGNQQSDEYEEFLKISLEYQNTGASDNLLDRLENINYNNTAFQTLYRELTLDLYHQKKQKKYLEKLESLLKKNDSENPEHLYNLYHLHIAKGDTPEIYKIEKQISSRSIGTPAESQLTAYKFMSNKNYDQALKEYERSLALKRTSRTLFYLANASWYKGDLQKAQDYLIESLTISPNSYESKSLYGLVLLTAGETESAQAILEDIVKSNPSDYYNLGNLGICYLLNKHYDDALRIYEQLLTQDRNNTTHMLNLADTYKLSGDAIQAKNMYEKVIGLTKNESETTETLRNLAQAYAQTKAFANALTTLQKLERLDAQNQETTYTAALVHTLVGNSASAILNIEKSLASGVNNIWFSFHWFNTMCSTPEFINIMKQYGEQNRCSP